MQRSPNCRSAVASPVWRHRETETQRWKMSSTDHSASPCERHEDTESCWIQPQVSNPLGWRRSTKYLTHKTQETFKCEKLGQTTLLARLGILQLCALSLCNKSTKVVCHTAKSPSSPVSFFHQRAVAGAKTINILAHRKHREIFLSLCRPFWAASCSRNFWARAVTGLFYQTATGGSIRSTIFQLLLSHLSFWTPQHPVTVSSIG